MTTALRVTAPPILTEAGDLKIKGNTSPTSYGVRHGVPIGPNKVIMVVFVPGIMGSNIKTKGTKESPAGEPAWRPPNGTVDGLSEVRKWKGRDSIARQALLNPDKTEIDTDGPINVGNEDEQKIFRKRGWGSVHMDSYGSLLFDLHNHLNRTFVPNRIFKGTSLASHWEDVQKEDQAQWGSPKWSPLDKDALTKYSEYQLPVYAVGYNWLRCNEEAADYLNTRIEAWIKEWQDAKHECEKVILISHSMGGLVTRAYAKKYPNRILGILHGVQPAVGAPAAYRRFTCGTEGDFPGAGWLDKKKADAFATIAGKTPRETQPVMAISPGPLELLPNHLYPAGWLQVKVDKKEGVCKEPDISLPKSDPYKEIYGDVESWWRLVNPDYIDPGNLYKDFGGASRPSGITGPVLKFKKALAVAERFHKEVVGTHYHPNTVAFYGADDKFPSFGSVSWHGKWTALDDMNKQDLALAKVSKDDSGSLTLKVGKEGPEAAKLREALKIGEYDMMPAVDPTLRVSISAQDTSGDGTVSWQSGSAPAKAGVKQVLKCTGFDHQGCYSNDAIKHLTMHVVCRFATNTALA